MSNQTVLITGTSSGLGNMLAHDLLEQGYTVFATMRDMNGKNKAQADTLRQRAQGKTNKLYLLNLDVQDEDSVEAAVAEALKHEGKIDILINNAGIGSSGYAEAFSTEQLQSTFDVNLFGVQRVMRAVLPSMRERGAGLVITISSAMGRIVIPFAAAYTASKYAVEALTESYHYELAPTGVDVVIVEPGGFASDYWGKLTTAADAARVSSYGVLANSADAFWAGISGVMQSEQAPSAQIIADAVVKLIQTPTGERPLRTVVDPANGGAGPTAVNKTTEQVQQQLLETFGLKNLLAVQS